MSAERRVARVARTRKHGVAAADFAGEEHAVAVVGQKGVFELVERLEIVGPGDADSGVAMIAVAPGDVVFVLDFDDTRVVAVDPGADLGIGPLQADVLFEDVPLSPSAENPTWSRMRMLVSSQRKTPA